MLAGGMELQKESGILFYVDRILVYISIIKKFVLFQEHFFTEEFNRMKKLKARMLLYFGGLLLVICIGLGIVAYTTSSGVLIQYSQETMPTFASEAS